MAAPEIIIFLKLPLGAKPLEAWGETASKLKPNSIHFYYSEATL